MSPFKPTWAHDIKKHATYSDMAITCIWVLLQAYTTQILVFWHQIQNGYFYNAGAWWAVRRYEHSYWAASVKKEI